MSPDEVCLRLGPADAAARVLFIPPLFEEANRTRRTIVMAMRALSARGIASLLPDLPGQNDSLVATADVDLSHWRCALTNQGIGEASPLFVASIRSGALMDDAVAAAGYWRLVPVAGANLLRTLLRARVASDRERGIETSVDQLIAEAASAPLRLAGNLLSPTMISQLHAAEPTPLTPLRSVTLGNGADQIAGSPLWLRAEPGEDFAMAEAMAKDISAWIATCAIA
ncbi:MAG: hypothetical protein HC788_08705 [Sphingopyxis sp.]|nr:hypothetical protein [Sphingopyxis sp.]